jgi:hypothetical protein
MVEEFAIGENASAEAQEGNYSDKKLRIVLMLLAYSAVMGVIACFLPEDETPGDFIIGVPILVLGVWWCFVDAEERGDRISMLRKWLLVLLFPVGFAIHVFRTRGVRGFITLGYVLLLVGMMGLCMALMAVFTVLVCHQLGF